MSCTNCPSKGFQDTATKTNTKDYKKNSPYDWLKDMPSAGSNSNIVEISFKNNRKAFYVNKKEIRLKRGDYVAVECDSGHDIGMISLTGKVADLQVKRKEPNQYPDKVIYRIATKNDIEKLTESRLKEKSILIKSRQLANRLGLEMKISDVEFQGDGKKATFYYIADARVDFRELIKLYASEFTVRIEMRQIGARQESALVGGMGSCGRELCCSSWRNKLDSVSTSAARLQELPQNAEKLTGQCGKLKCCLMYELDQYIEAHSDFPDVLLELETENGIAYPRKKDLLKKIIWYSVGAKDGSQIIPVPLERAKEIIQLNKKGVKPALTENDYVNKPDYSDSGMQMDVNKLKTKDKNKPKKYNRRNNRGKKTRTENN